MGQTWSYGSILTGQNFANCVSVALDPKEDHWAVAFDASGTLRLARYARYPGYFTMEIVGNGGAAASLAFDPKGSPSISHVLDGHLLFAVKGGKSWRTTQIEGQDVAPYDTSLCYDGGGQPRISYCRTGNMGGLWLARRVSSWSTELVDSDAGASFNQLATDPRGNSAIAYSADLNFDGTVDAVKFAHFNGSSWEISLVDTVGCLSVSVAYDVSGTPAVACRSASSNELRFFRWTSDGWSAPEFVDPTADVLSCSLKFAPNNDTPVIAYLTSTDMRVARRDLLSGVWMVQIVDPTPGVTRNSLTVHSDGRLVTAYGVTGSSATERALRLAHEGAP